MSSSGHGSGACESTVDPVIDSEGSALSSLPHSFPTSRDEEDDEEEDDDSSCQPSHELPWSRSVTIFTRNNEKVKAIKQQIKLYSSNQLLVGFN